MRGKEKDLAVVDKVIREIDVRTKQVLMEVFIVEATSSFERELGARLGAAYSRRGVRAGGQQDGSTVLAPSGANSRLGDDTTVGNDSLFNFPAAAATSGIGVLRKTGSAVLKVELEALESQGLSKTISNPKLFSLDNQTATIKQGEQLSLIHISEPTRP